MSIYHTVRWGGGKRKFPSNFEKLHLRNAPVKYRNMSVQKHMCVESARVDVGRKLLIKYTQITRTTHPCDKLPYAKASLQFRVLMNEHVAQQIQGL
jgi:hypothetical protein